MSDRKKWGRRYSDNQAYPKGDPWTELPTLDVEKLVAPRSKKYRIRIVDIGNTAELLADKFYDITGIHVRIAVHGSQVLKSRLPTAGSDIDFIVESPAQTKRERQRDLRVIANVKGEVENETGYKLDVVVFWSPLESLNFPGQRMVYG